MEATKPLGRLLYLGPPLAAVLLLRTAPSAPLHAGAIFFLLSIYARMAAVAARAGKGEEALLFVEILPFLAYGIGFLCSLQLSAAALALTECALVWAALIWLENLVLGSRLGFGPALAFMVSAAAAGWCIDRFDPPIVLGLSLLTMLGCAYAQARGSRP